MLTVATARAGASHRLVIYSTVYVLFLGWFLLNPSPADSTWAITHARMMLQDLTCRPLDGGVVEFAGNVVLLVPVPVLGVCWTRSAPGAAWSWSAAVLVASVLVEVIQGTFLPQRSPEIADVVANALGGGLGAVAVTAFLKGSVRDQAPEPMPRFGSIRLTVASTDDGRLGHSGG